MHNPKPAILIVDDDQSVRDTFHSILNKNSAVFLASTGEEALQIIRNNHLDIIFLDIKLPDTDGLQILEIIKKYFPNIDVVMISILSELPTVVKAIKGGAFDYIGKEIDPTKILHLVDIIWEKRQKDFELLYLKNELLSYTEKEVVFGSTTRMAKIRELIKKIADLPTTVLIQGETGTGKELIAREIHKNSRYKNFPFVSVNLAALPKELIESTLFGHEKGAFTGAVKQNIGKFELANNGILFLDEIGELEYGLQAKLLRVIQEGEIERVGSNRPIKLNVRIVAATSRDLEGMIETGTFRKDLFFRLNIVPLKLPPLRERIEDMETLANLFISRYSRKFGKKIHSITHEALTYLKSYEWPGNIRELENLIERIVAVSDKLIIDEDAIPFDYFLRSVSLKFEGENYKKILKSSLETFERNMIMRGLKIHHYDKIKTASMLGLPLSTLKYKIKKLNVHDEEEPGDKKISFVEKMGQT